ARRAHRRSRTRCRHRRVARKLVGGAARPSGERAHAREPMPPPFGPSGGAPMTTTKQDAKARLAAVRTELAALAVQRKQLEAAPVPIEEARARVDRFVKASIPNPGWMPAVASLARAEGPTPAHALDLVPTEGRMLQCFLASILQAPMAEGVVLALE